MSTTSFQSPTLGLLRHLSQLSSLELNASLHEHNLANKLGREVARIEIRREGAFPSNPRRIYMSTLKEVGWVVEEDVQHCMRCQTAWKTTEQPCVTAEVTSFFDFDVMESPTTPSEMVSLACASTDSCISTGSRNMDHEREHCHTCGDLVCAKCWRPNYVSNKEDLGLLPVCKNCIKSNHTSLSPMASPKKRDSMRGSLLRRASSTDSKSSFDFSSRSNDQNESEVVLSKPNTSSRLGVASMHRVHSSTSSEDFTDCSISSSESNGLFSLPPATRSPPLSAKKSTWSLEDAKRYSQELNRSILHLLTNTTEYDSSPARFTTAEPVYVIRTHLPASLASGTATDQRSVFEFNNTTFNAILPVYINVLRDDCLDDVDMELNDHQRTICFATVKVAADGEELAYRRKLSSNPSLVFSVVVSSRSLQGYSSDNFDDATCIIQQINQFYQLCLHYTDNFTLPHVSNNFYGSPLDAESFQAQIVTPRY